ncbi:hypothetical protein [Phaeodactylibacter sp.]|jgi:hypothetical protein|uniref:hypothetical protein n=1 Tax=Phaeodactylibacter sp. TaxID=1940289 RepID=UPI0025FB7A95|nr:hypothetical protein [Phaeodactylibacter sp.]MCI4649927.1 hypothetical protein [Phaeodactylibacter sp.]MCI5090157.1 hypothetical protein [Phaeodactylibacter sp.]
MKVLNFIPALALLLFAGFSLSSCAKEEAAEVLVPTTHLELGDRELQFSEGFSLPAEAPNWTEEQIVDYIKSVKNGEVIVERSYDHDDYVSACGQCAAFHPQSLKICVGGDAYVVITTNFLYSGSCSSCDLSMLWNVYRYPEGSSIVNCTVGP